jgi:hypothetical protein
MIFPTISFTISKKILKNPKPCHHSNRRINRTKTQHHYLTMPSSKSTTFDISRSGDIPLLTHHNYDEWKYDMILVLSCIIAYAIVSREDPESPQLDFDHDDNYDHWKDKEAATASIITLSCSPEVQCIVKGIRNDQKMWNTLETSLDTAGSYIGREDILRQFCACRPKEDEPLKAYFTKLSNCRIQFRPYRRCNHWSWFLHTNIHITASSVCNDMNSPKT